MSPVRCWASTAASYSDGKNIKVLLDFFLWGNLPPVCLRVSPGLLRHSCGPASCHTSSMAAKLRLALTQNSSPTPLANRRRVALIAESRGRAPGRPPQRAKLPQRPKAPSADGAIPGAAEGRRPHPVSGWRTAAFSPFSFLCICQSASPFSSIAGNGWPYGEDRPV